MHSEPCTDPKACHFLLTWTMSRGSITTEVTSPTGKYIYTAWAPRASLHTAPVVIPAGTHLVNKLKLHLFIALLISHVFQTQAHQPSDYRQKYHMWFLTNFLCTHRNESSLLCHARVFHSVHPNTLYIIL